MKHPRSIPKARREICLEIYRHEVLDRLRPHHGNAKLIPKR